MNIDDPAFEKSDESLYRGILQRRAEGAGILADDALALAISRRNDGRFLLCRLRRQIGRQGNGGRQFFVLRVLQWSGGLSAIVVGTRNDRVRYGTGRLFIFDVV